MTKSKITIKGLYLIFGKEPEAAFKGIDQGKNKQEILDETGCTIAVNNANFEVKEGETFVIMGLSGSGKSTLIRCLNRLIEPTSGEVFIDDTNVLEASEETLRGMRRNKMAMVFQHFGLLPHRSVLSNIAFGLEIFGFKKKEREEKAMGTLEMVGLEGYEDKMTGELSGGMQQRVGLARALAMDPEILLMDEAFSALDPLIRTQMQEELIKIQEKMARTIVFITHDLDEALKLGDRIAIMNEGVIVQTGTPEDILINPVNEYVRSFVKNVHKDEVITASRIMDKEVKVWQWEELEQLKQTQKTKNGILPVIDEKQKLLGYFNQGEQAKLKAEDGLIREIPKVGPDIHVIDMLRIAWYNEVPIAVVDEFDRFLGWVPRNKVIDFITSKQKGEVKA